MATGTTISKAKGSTGSDVTEWQGLLTQAGFPTPVTGVFDETTDQQTRAWQKQKGLVADGVVGPASWKAMTGLVVAPPDPKAKFARDVMLSVMPGVLEEARSSKYPEVQALGAEPTTLGELQTFQAMAHLESGYGAGKYTNKLTGETAVLNNWGAIQAGKPPCGPGKFEVTDTGPQGEYQMCYGFYETPEDGARHLLRHLTVLRPASWALAKKGDLDAYSVQMHSWTPPLTQLGVGHGSSKHNLDPVTKMPGYFEQPPLTANGRAAGLEKRVAAIASALGEPVMARRGGPVDQGGGGAGPGEIIPGFGPAPAGTAAIARAGLLAAIVGGVVWYFWKPISKWVGL